MAELTVEQQQAIAIANARARAAQAKPEQGNMYTQGAEDIVYSPEGIPLNTSSYGSAPKGFAKDVQQGLTSATALPLNIATGVAKAPAGIAQALSKLMGSNAGDVPVNAINQIERGTQAQMGGVGQAASQVGSMVGQAAPFMAGGGIGQIPSFAQKVGTGARAGVLSGLATPEETGLNQQDFIQAKGQNMALQGGIGGAFPVLGAGASKLANMVRGGVQPPALAQGVEKARELGYVMPPSQAKPSLLNRLLEGTAGKISTAQNASAKNQDITNKLASKSLGLPEDTVLSPEILTGIRNKAGTAYENIGLSGEIKPDATYIESLNKIAAPFVKTAKAFPDAKPSPVIELVESFKSPSFDASAAVEKIKQLRTAADDAFRKGDTDVARASKNIADSMENAIEKHLETIKQPELLDKFREARELIAKTYTVEKALNKSTGTVDAKKLADRLQAGKPMSGELKDIGEFAAQFPKATQVPEKMGSLPQFSPLDVASSAATGGLSYLTGNKEEAGPLGLAALLMRPGARYAALSGPVQNRLVQKEAGKAIPQSVKQALPSSEEAKRLAKILLMQSAGEAAQ